MGRDESKYELAIAVAALKLSFHNTAALLHHNLLSPAKRHECAEALRLLVLELEGSATDPDEEHESLKGIREMIDRLDHQ